MVAIKRRRGSPASTLGCGADGADADCALVEACCSKFQGFIDSRLEHPASWNATVTTAITPHRRCDTTGPRLRVLRLVRICLSTTVRPTPYVPDLPLGDGRRIILRRRRVPQEF